MIFADDFCCWGGDKNFWFSKRVIVQINKLCATVLLSEKSEFFWNSLAEPEPSSPSSWNSTILAASRAGWTFVVSLRTRIIRYLLKKKKIIICISISARYRCSLHVRLLYLSMFLLYNNSNTNRRILSD